MAHRCRFKDNIKLFLHETRDEGVDSSRLTQTRRGCTDRGDGTLGFIKYREYVDHVNKWTAKTSLIPDVFTLKYFYRIQTPYRIEKYTFA
jgi:hypothetical protein